MAISVGTISAPTISVGNITGGALGPELNFNSDMSQGASGWIFTEATGMALTDSGEDAVLITATAANARGHMSVAGLTIGNNYKVVVRARRGAQGTDQEIRSFQWCTIPTTSIATGSYVDYEFDVVATAVSGVSRIYANFGTGIGDEAYVSTLSIREILQ